MQRLCIVTPDAGVGGACEPFASYLELAASYAALETCDVTLLVPGGEGSVPLALPPIPECLRVVRLPAQRTLYGEHGAAWFGRRSLRIYEWLRERAFDLIVFPSMLGTGFMSLQAKVTGQAFHTTLLAVRMEPPARMLREGAGCLPENPLVELRLDFVERYACERCDFLISPDDELFTWATQSGWQLPRHAVEQSAQTWFALRDMPVGFTARLDSPLPTVSVCVTYYNYGKFLPQALQSLADNDYPGLQVVVVDDGSTSDVCRDVFDAQQTRYAQLGWKFVRTENRGLGAARNTCVQHATGELLMFMDADNYAKPDMVRRFAMGMVASGADCLTSHFEAFEGDGPPDAATPPGYVVTPLGPLMELAPLENVFGDANFAIRRDVFVAQGGFTERRGLNFEDWEFLASLNMAGYTQDVVPARLFHYRHHGKSMLRTYRDRLGDVQRTSQPFARNTVDMEGFLVRVAVPLFGRLRNKEASTRNLRRRIKRERHAAHQARAKDHAHHAQAVARLSDENAALERERAALREQVAALSTVLERDGHRLVERANGLLNRFPRAKRTLLVAVKTSASAGRATLCWWSGQRPL